MKKQGKNRVLLMHGWGSNSREHWFLEEKQRLEKLGLEVSAPDMPNTFFPKTVEWVNVVEEFYPDETSVLVGHSLGGTAILRYLEKTDKKIGLVVLIATPIQKLGDGFEAINEFLEPDFNWENIKNSCKKFVVINQSRDESVPLQHGKALAEHTAGELVEVDGNNHFDTIDFSLLERYIVSKVG